MTLDKHWRHDMKFSPIALAASLSIAAALCLTTAPPAHANDAVFGGTGASITPIAEKRLKMASESIAIREKAASTSWNGARHWDIEATYSFENPTDEPITAQFGFPEYTCDEGGDCNSKNGSPYTFYNMQTTVAGKKVKLSTGKVDSKSQWGEILGRVHLFDVTIPAGKRVEVVHRYQMGKSGSFMQDDWVMYITRTGALWNGPIGSAKFSIELLERPWGFSFPADYELAKFETSRDGKKTTIDFEMKEWTPKQDLHVVLGSDFGEMAGCPSLEMNLERFYEEGSREPRLESVEEVFASHSLEQIRRCRNLVYAAHGYTFKDRTLQDFLYKYSTPVDVEKTEGFWGYVYAHGGDGPFKAVVFAPDANYASSHLSERETRWVKALKMLEKKKAKEKPKK